MELREAVVTSTGNCQNVHTRKRQAECFSKYFGPICPSPRIWPTNNWSNVNEPINPACFSLLAQPASSDASTRPEMQSSTFLYIGLEDWGAVKELDQILGAAPALELPQSASSCHNGVGLMWEFLLLSLHWRTNSSQERERIEGKDRRRERTSQTCSVVKSILISLRRRYLFMKPLPFLLPASRK